MLAKHNGSDKRWCRGKGKYQRIASSAISLPFPLFFQQRIGYRIHHRSENTNLSTCSPWRKWCRLSWVKGLKGIHKGSWWGHVGAGSCKTDPVVRPQVGCRRGGLHHQELNPHPVLPMTYKLAGICSSQSNSQY